MKHNHRVSNAKDHLKEMVRRIRRPSDARVSVEPGYAYLNTRHILAAVTLRTLRHVPVDLPWIRRGLDLKSGRPFARLSSSVTAFYRHTPALPCVAIVTDIVMASGGPSIFSRTTYLRSSGDRFPTSSANMGDVPLCQEALEGHLAEWYACTLKVSNMAHRAWTVSPARITQHRQDASGVHTWADGALVSVPDLVGMGFDYR